VQKEDDSKMEFEYADYVHLKDILSDVVTSFGEREQGMSTGLSGLDERIRGVSGGEYIIVAGRPSMGKSALLASMSLKLSEQGVVVVFSLEMNRRLFVERLLASLARVNFHHLKLGRATQHDWEALDWAARELQKRQLILDDNSFLSPFLLNQKLEHLAQHFEVKCVMIDYLQLMAAGRRESRQQEITEISRMLKATAKTFNVALIVACQLNRAVENRENNIPRLSDLRESGSLEQDADKVLLLHRPSYYELKYDSNWDCSLLLGFRLYGFL